MEVEAVKTVIEISITTFLIYSYCPFFYLQYIINNK